MGLLIAGAPHSEIMGPPARGAPQEEQFNTTVRGKGIMKLVSAPQIFSMT